MKILLSIILCMLLSISCFATNVESLPSDSLTEDIIVSESELLPIPNRNERSAERERAKPNEEQLAERSEVLGENDQSATNAGEESNSSLEDSDLTIISDINEASLQLFEETNELMNSGAVEQPPIDDTISNASQFETLNEIRDLLNIQVYFIYPFSVCCVGVYLILRFVFRNYVG